MIKDKLKDTVLETVAVYDKYSLGMEIEFWTSQWMSKKYAREFDLDDRSWSSKNMYSILGYDGSGKSTKEFRSPVFISDNPEEAFNSLVEFVVEVQKYLVKDFHGKFLPYYYRHPMGIHFSIGGKFFNLNRELIKRAKIVQPKLVTQLSEEDKTVYLNRENTRYSGHINQYFESLNDFNCFSIPIRNFGTRAEFRFFPSCDVETLIPYLQFLIFDTAEPNNQIKFIK